MSLKDLRDLLNEEVEQILSADFKVTVKETDVVPSVNDADITYPNLETMEQKCKLIETCVLYIDIRRSTELNLSHRRETVTKLYSTFVRSMVKGAQYHGGKVRGIVGDRVMVMFNRQKCFENSIDTAVLMSSISQCIINKHFDKNDVKCGIGIDYGKMLVSKNGIIKKGSESTSSKSLVWLGRPANLASKLTDIANKTITETKEKLMVQEGHYYDALNKWGWYDFAADTFLDSLQATSSQYLKHKTEYFRTFRKYGKTTESHFETPPILFTKSVYDGLETEAPEEQGYKSGWWSKQTGFSVPEYSGDIYGGDVIFSIFNQ